MVPETETTIVRARVEDVAGIEAIINAAYAKYVDRIGYPPAPMLANYTELLEKKDVYVLRMGDNGKIIGSIVLAADDEGKSIKVNNLVVDTAAQGRGYGRMLMEYAEAVARARGLSAVTLFTNIKMHENIDLYIKLGFTETGRRIEGPYERVYFWKDLP